MGTKILWLRISYWIGAIADGFAAIPMLFPEIGKIVFGTYDLVPTSEYMYAMRIGAALMIGWAFLLIWADRKPVERKGILLLTLFPVLTGLMLAGIPAVTSGLIRLERMILVWIMQGILFSVFAFSYINARDTR